ncbi:hypothetical protein B0J11DRAFT_115453 [Dendryphion nanum]|uniref:Uncharacterized protein n=1 Tax=Dendryphion nanum TaxID=256645 RepID=A0A9P9DBB8_9PLEO|nr:hypothetical protein B0J11DRAFT_115453 [Dendryphion nanum]
MYIFQYVMWQGHVDYFDPLHTSVLLFGSATITEVCSILLSILLASLCILFLSPLFCFVALKRAFSDAGYWHCPSLMTSMGFSLSFFVSSALGIGKVHWIVHPWFRFLAYLGALFSS